MSKNILKRLGYLFGTLTLTVASLPLVPASAAQLTSRYVTLSSSSNAGSSATTTYSFGVTVGTSGTVKSVQALPCTTATGTCTTPTGFDGTSATVGTGDTSTWTDESTSTTLKASDATGGSWTGAQTFSWDSVQNPTTSAPNNTFFLRITTYSDAAYSSAVDTGVVATAVTPSINVTAVVDETLVFCTGTGTSISSPGNCSAPSGTDVTLTQGGDGTGANVDPSNVAYGHSEFGVSTNANGGYAVTYSGNTLTDSSNAKTITAIGGIAATSSPGSEQFGLNTVANTAPTIGSAPAGGTGAAAGQYATANNFAFQTGDTVANSAGAASNFTAYQVSYIANISGITEAGTYTTSLNYVATATF